MPAATTHASSTLPEHALEHLRAPVSIIARGRVECKKESDDERKFGLKTCARSSMWSDGRINGRTLCDITWSDTYMR
jgi:hypothetical protein